MTNQFSSFRTKGRLELDKIKKSMTRDVQVNLSESSESPIRDQNAFASSLFLFLSFF